MKRLIIIGASGHGKVCADIARLNGYEEIQFLDDDKNRKACGGYSVIGTVSAYQYLKEALPFFVAVGRSHARKKITEEILRSGGKIITLLHPSAVIAEGVCIGTGSVVMAGTVINPGTVIGRGCIINTSSSVDHDCTIGDFTHIAAGAHLAGTVEVGCGTWIGVGATVSNNLNVCGGCMIGAGAVVVKDIKGQGTYTGVPARRIKGKNWDI